MCYSCLVYIYFHRTLSGVPIFELPPSKYYAFQIMEILLDPNIDENKIAKERPLQTQCSSTFVVDITRLAHPDDIKICTANGCTKALTRTFFGVHLINTTKCVLKKQPQVHLAPMSTTSDDCTVCIPQIRDLEGSWPSFLVSNIYKKSIDRFLHLA